MGLESAEPPNLLSSSEARLADNRASIQSEEASVRTPLIVLGMVFFGP